MLSARLSLCGCPVVACARAFFLTRSPHAIDFLFEDPWGKVSNEDDDTIRILGWALTIVMGLVILLVVPNDELWRHLGEEIREGVFPKRALVIDGRVVSRETLRGQQEMRL